MPVDPPDEALDPMRTLVRNAQIQRACIAFARGDARDRRHPAAGLRRLAHHLHRAGAKRRPRPAGAARAGPAFQAFVKERFHVRSIVGIGRTLAPGAPLHPSHREAMLALHMCAQLEKDVLFYDEHAGGATAPLRRAAARRRRPGRGLRARERRRDPAGQRQVRAAGAELLRRAHRGGAQPVPGDAVPAAGPGSSGATRSAPRRATASPATSPAKLEEAQSLYQVIEGFKEALARLGLVSSSALHGPKVLRLEATLQYLRENFAEPLRLPEVARRAGFSVPVFTRAFKQATGTSFLSYVRSLRVEHAKSLLASSRADHRADRPELRFPVAAPPAALVQEGGRARPPANTAAFTPSATPSSGRRKKNAHGRNSWWRRPISARAARRGHEALSSCPRITTRRMTMIQNELSDEALELVVGGHDGSEEKICKTTRTTLPDGTIVEDTRCVIKKKGKQEPTTSPTGRRSSPRPCGDVRRGSPGHGGTLR